MTLTSPGAIAFHVGPITVRWYGLFITAGFLLATWAAARLARRRNIDVDSALNCALLGFIGGIIGARLYFVALSWQFFRDHPSEIFQIWLGGLSLHGGIVGGIIVAYVYCRITRLPFLTGMDIAGAVTPLAQAIGRWGNFFNSEAFGRPVGPGFPLAVQIPPAQRPAGMENFQYFQATFLYESIWDLAIFFLLYFFFFERLKKYPGMNFLLYLLLYSIGRALIEPMRTDSIMVGGVAAPLVVSIILWFGCLVGMVLLWHYYKHEQTKGPDEKRLNED